MAKSTDTRVTLDDAPPGYLDEAIQGGAFVTNPYAGTTLVAPSPSPVRTPAPSPAPAANSNIEARVGAVEGPAPAELSGIEEYGPLNTGPWVPTAPISTERSPTSPVDVQRMNNLEGSAPAVPVNDWIAIDRGRLVMDPGTGTWSVRTDGLGLTDAGYSLFRGSNGQYMLAPVAPGDTANTVASGNGRLLTLQKPDIKSELPTGLPQMWGTIAASAIGGLAQFLVANRMTKLQLEAQREMLDAQFQIAERQEDAEESRRQRRDTSMAAAFRASMRKARGGKE